MIIEPLRHSDFDGLNRVRSRWETARRTLFAEHDVPYTLHYLPGPGRLAEAIVTLALRELPRGRTVGFLVGVEDRPGLPLSPMSRSETQVAWDRFEDLLKQERMQYRIVRTAYALHPDCVGDRVHVERPHDTETYRWREESLHDEDDVDEDADEELDDEELDDDGEGAADEEEVEEKDEPVEPVFVLLLEVSALTTSA